MLFLSLFNGLFEINAFNQIPKITLEMAWEANE